MAYDPYKYIKNVYDAKVAWGNATTDEERKKQKSIADSARTSLEQNGYGDVANRISAYGADVDAAKLVLEKYKSHGKTETRPYLYSLGKSRGMSKSDIDNLISWDETTGEVSFGGKKIGRPDAVVDGVSYWNDTSVLDNAFNGYIDRSGTVRSKSAAVNQENEKLFAKYNQEYDDLKKTNPFETETAKAILAKYDLAGLQGRDNAVADNAGYNGGNIDSFAAANALRQQASLINQGQMVVLDEYNQKLEHARGLLSDMGVNIDRVFNQDETAKNNEVARKSEIASVSGYTPDEWTVSNNPYMNDDGTIKDEFKNADFSEIMARAKAAGNTSAYNAAATARFYKIMGDYGLYGKWDDGNYIVPGPQRTADYDLTKQQLDSAERIANSGNETSLALADKEATTSLALADKEAASAINNINAQKEAEKEILKETSKYGTSGSDDYAEYNALLKQFDVSDSGPRNFIEKEIKPIYEGKEVMTEEGLKQLILNNSEEYDLDIEDAKTICRAFGVDVTWLNNYKNRSNSDADPEGDYKGIYHAN